MDTRVNGLRRIVPSDGMTLYNGEVLSKEVYLGVNDSAENWREITDAEAEIIANNEEASEEERATDEDYQKALRELGVKI